MKGINIQVWKGESLNGQRIIGQTKEPGLLRAKEMTLKAKFF